MVEGKCHRSLVGSFLYFSLRLSVCFSLSLSLSLSLSTLDSNDCFVFHTGHFVSFGLVFVAVYCKRENKCEPELGEWMYVILFSPLELIHSPSSNEFALPHSFVSYCTFRSRLSESKFDGEREEQTVTAKWDFHLGSFIPFFFSRSPNFSFPSYCLNCIYTSVEINSPSCTSRFRFSLSLSLSLFLSPLSFFLSYCNRDAKWWADVR